MADDFLQPKLILGEGKGDRFFFARLFKEHNLQGFQADTPKVGDDTSGGIDKFGRHLEAIAVASTFVNVKKIVVVADNDEANTFTEVCAQLASAKYNVPAAPKVFVKTDGKPDIAILMIPDTPPGCLEVLCYTAASRKWPDLVNPFATYFAATPAVGWSVTKQAKMKVQCVLASTCKPNPAVGLYDHWQKSPQYHIPVTDPVFQDIVDFLLAM
jgi:hypothetical protein